MKAFLCLLLSILYGCETPKKPRPDLEDYSLDDSLSGPNEVEESRYYDDLETSTEAIRFPSSFPLIFAVEKSKNKFKSPPTTAHNPEASAIKVKIGPCQLYVQTKNIQVERFLYTDRFIKFGAEIRAGSKVKLKPNMDLNLRMTSQLLVNLPEKFKRACWKTLYGRKTYIGRFHMYPSSARLLHSPGSFPRSFKMFPPEKRRGSQAYIHWNRGQSAPVLKNELDFPVTVESSFFRTYLGDHGVYYISFAPLLRSMHSRSNELIIPEQKSRKPKTTLE